MSIASAPYATTAPLGARCFCSLLKQIMKFDLAESNLAPDSASLLGTKLTIVSTIQVRCQTIVPLLAARS
jgi:hypothetical protein